MQLDPERKAVILAKHAAKYKDRPSRGLGDTVSRITSKMGIEPCKGCKKRQKFLNKIVPYRSREEEDHANP